MQRFLILTVFFLSFVATGAHADFREGLNAYRNGDYGSAFEAWLPLAEQGDPKAQNNVGILYRKGLGVKKNPAAAFMWYERAAKQSFAKAQYNLALAYKRGHGVDRSANMAVKWYELAALNGYARAQYEMGVRYDNGVGVKQDRVAALMWLTLSVKTAKGKTLRNASKARRRLMGTLGQKQISEAERLAAEVQVGS